MQRRLLLVGLLALVLGLRPGGKPRPDSLQAPLEAFSEHLNDRVPALLAHYDVPGAAVSLIQNGARAWTGTYGLADRQARRPVTPGTIFRVGSISKSITAWGVMRLVEQGNLRLRDPVAAHLDGWALPASPFAADQVTVRRLLTHTAGLTSGPYPQPPPGGSPPPLEALLSAGTKGPPARPQQAPGSSFRYSNAGFALLELLIEDVSGQAFEAYMRDSVLAPLGMTDASFRRTEAVRSRIATGYLVDGRPSPPFIDAVKAPGGLYASVGDVARFVAAGISGAQGDSPGSAVLPREAVRRLHAPTVDTQGLVGLTAGAYGLGHFVEMLPGGQRAISHGGQHTGWMAHFHFLPEVGAGIVVLTNSERAMPLIADILDVWTTWQGIPAVGLSRAFAWVTFAGWGLLLCLWLGAAWGAWRIGRAWLRGTRTLAPWSGRRRGVRALWVFLAGLVAVGLWLGRDWEVLGVFMPVLSHRLGVALGAWGGLLLLAAILPRRSRTV